MGAYKRVAILINCLEIGGAQKIASMLLRFLKEKGYKAYLVLLDKQIDHSYMIGDGSEDIFILGKTKVESSTVLKALSFPCLWVNAFFIPEVDIVLSFMERANIFNLTLVGAKKRIISIRNYIPTFFESKTFLKRFLIEKAYSFLLKRADIVNFNSYESAYGFQKLFQIPERKLSIIPNMCDISAIRTYSDKVLSQNLIHVFSGRTIVSMGRLIPNKCHARLIRAFKVVEKRFNDVKLVIIGGGPMYKKLEELITKLGLEGKVYLTGFLENPFPCIKRACLFVLPSMNEGFPNSLLEAMALGKPVISTDCSSGPREILAPQTNPLKKTKEVEPVSCGVLVPSFKRGYLDANEAITEKERKLADAVCLLLENEALRKAYCKASTKRVFDFSPEKVLKDWLRLFEEVSYG